MIYVIGARGRVGRAIAASKVFSDVVLLERALYEDWWRPGSDAAIASFFEAAPAGSVVMVAAGLLDPALPVDVHRRVNVELPVRIMDGVRATGLKVVTFGTVMERLSAHPNAYVASKAELGREVTRRVGEGASVLHLQIHTLYGNAPPAPFMFLGQMCHALRHGLPFEMSPGRQLREYHHVDDDVRALWAMLGAGASGVVPLSHGAPDTLADLASAVFQAVGRSDLLRIGARPEPPDDNYATVLERPQVLNGIDFRPAREGVAVYVQTQLKEQKARDA